MPIYEYICKSCEFEFEKIRSFSDSSMPLCPSCENEDVERKMAVPAIHFKGSGWYINDSKSSNKKKGTSEGTSASGDSSKSSDGASEQSDSSSGDSDSSKGKGEATSSSDKPKESSSSKTKTESSSKKPAS